MVYCRKCKFENNPENITCVNCDTKMHKKRVPRKPKAFAPYRHGPNYCEKCNTYKTYSSYGIIGTFFPATM